MLEDGDTVRKGHVDSGLEVVRLRSDKSPMEYGIRSLVLMMLDESHLLVWPIGSCSTAMCMATSTRSSAVDGMSVGFVFDNAKLLTWGLSCPLKW
jgi:hypothetical protein